ncbi:MAG: hypothetical protein QCI00_08270 [Candidatus Thermoplasmatota archaeon]|nr:hypothetical protein [Candidatus Thermoplasmatota archaeon]
MDFDITRKKVNIFKIGTLYCFKQYFDDRELFKELSEYYNERSFRFEIKTAGERNKIMKLLWSKGYEPILVEDFQEYMVKIDRYKKYGDILKNSIEYLELGGNRVFVMKDVLSVEQALELGAEQFTDEIEFERLRLF